MPGALTRAAAMIHLVRDDQYAEVATGDDDDTRGERMVRATGATLPPQVGAGHHHRAGVGQAIRIYLASFFGLAGATLAVAIVLVVLADLDIPSDIWLLAQFAGLVLSLVVALGGFVVSSRLFLSQLWPDEPPASWRELRQPGDPRP